jgi:hypothetical protein
VVINTSIRLAHAFCISFRDTPPQRITRAANVVSIFRLTVYPMGRAAQLMRVSWTGAVVPKKDGLQVITMLLSPAGEQKPRIIVMTTYEAEEDIRGRWAWISRQR